MRISEQISENLISQHPRRTSMQVRFLFVVGHHVSWRVFELSMLTINLFKSLLAEQSGFVSAFPKPSLRVSCEQHDELPLVAPVKTLHN
jgi:hypothetical protein